MRWCRILRSFASLRMTGSEPRAQLFQIAPRHVADERVRQAVGAPRHALEAMRTARQQRDPCDEEQVAYLGVLGSDRSAMHLGCSLLSVSPSDFTDCLNGCKIPPWPSSISKSVPKSAAGLVQLLIFKWCRETQSAQMAPSRERTPSRLCRMAVPQRAIPQSRIA